MKLGARFTLVMILATTLISLLVGGYAVITTKNSQLSLVNHDLNTIVASTRVAHGGAISAALLTVQENNLDAIVDFVDAGTVSQLSLATFHVTRMPAPSQFLAAAHAVKSSTAGGGIRFRTVTLAGHGSLFIAMSTAIVKRSIHQLILRLLLFTLLADAVVGGTVWIFIRRDTKKIEQLIALANDIADKNEGVMLPESSGRTDVDQLSSALGRMVGALSDAVVMEQNVSLRMQQFLGDASHELRTPLTVIRGYTELLGNEHAPPPEVQRRALARMNDEVQRMDRLISDLLLVAELGEQHLSRDERIDVTSLLKTHLEDLRTLEPNRKIESTIADGVAILGTSSHVSRLLQNLFANIRRHTPREAPVRVALTESGGLVALRIEDGGPGLPTAAYTRGPQGFMRFDQSRSRESGGSGLGMSIIVAIVKELGGSIELRPSDLGGLAVWVELPSSPW